MKFLHDIGPALDFRRRGKDAGAVDRLVGCGEAFMG